jgi:hypothetical protein
MPMIKFLARATANVANVVGPWLIIVRRLADTLKAQRFSDPGSNLQKGSKI